MPHHEDDDLDMAKIAREDRAAVRAELPPELPPEELSPEASVRVRRTFFRSDADAAPRIPDDENYPGKVLKMEEEEGDSLVGIEGFRPPFLHLNELPRLVQEDLDFIIEKDQEYNASWKARGGVGAFMMLARKWDRLEPLAKKYGYDIFKMLEEHPDRIDDVRDLRRYLALVECEWRVNTGPGIETRMAMGRSR